jgi:hypothetical protein
VSELLQVLVEASEQAGTRRVAALHRRGGAQFPCLLQRAEAARLPVYEGYGLSECGLVVCLNTPQARRPTVARPLGSARVCVDATDSLRGWLCHAICVPRNAGAKIQTGDRGAFDADGYLRLVAGNVFIRVSAATLHRNGSSANSQRLRAAGHGLRRARPHRISQADACRADGAAIEAAIAARMPCYRPITGAPLGARTQASPHQWDAALALRRQVSRHAELDAVYRVTCFLIDDERSSFVFLRATGPRNSTRPGLPAGGPCHPEVRLATSRELCTIS